jgi:hypothetical protein
MKLITRGDTQLINSAYLTHNSVYAKLVINTRLKWPQWQDIGTCALYSEEFPIQLGAFAIEGDKGNAVLMVVPDGGGDLGCLQRATRYYCLEKDQLAIVWLPNTLELQRATQLCVLGA